MNGQSLWPGGPEYIGERVQADALLLASFAASVRASSLCELGCGDGIGLLLAAWNHGEANIVGIEADRESAERARENLRRNRLTERVQVVEGDLRGRDGRKFELVFANPPYFSPGRGAVSPTPRRAGERTESATLSELCESAAARLSHGGRFCLIHRAERFCELCEALRDAELEPKRIRVILADAHHAPTLLLVEARRGGKSGLRWEPPLLIRGEDGRETAEYKSMTHWE